MTVSETRTQGADGERAEDIDALDFDTPEPSGGDCASLESAPDELIEDSGDTVAAADLDDIDDDDARNSAWAAGEAALAMIVLDGPAETADTSTIADASTSAGTSAADSAEDEADAVGASDADEAAAAERGSVTETAEQPAAPEPAPAAGGSAAPAVTPPALKPGSIRRAPALDGLRGIAVLAVVVYHLFGTVLRGGYIGVDIFFVLSGFLITSLLVREYGARGSISLSGFWVRRLRRIVPAAVTVLVVATAVAGMIGGDVAVKLWPQFLSSAFFVNNWSQIASAESYFADTTPRIFMHYWSLAIEEQFYVIWPLVFLALMWLARGKTVRTRMIFALRVAVVVGLSSALTMALLYRPDEDPSRVYFGSDSHVFGLLTGVALALWITTPSPQAADSWPSRLSRQSAALVGWTVGPLVFAGLVATLFLVSDTSPIAYRGGLLAACLLTAAVVHNAVRESGPVPQLLRLPLLRWLGERSFSLYLWHWPVVVFVRELAAGPGGTSSLSVWEIGAIAAVITVLVSELSYRWIETPFRRYGFRGALSKLGENSSRIVPGIAVAVGLVVVLLAGSALGTSPAKSALETQLDQLAELQRQANAAPPPPPKASNELPPGTEISGVGDSVMLASSQELMRRFPGMYIDAEVSRHYTGGEPVIEGLKARGELREYVVLGFGTNGQAFPGQLNRILRMIGPKRKVILVVPFGPVDGIPQAARQVLDYAPRHKNVYLAPWCSAAAAHPQDLSDDGVHPVGPAGVGLYTDAVATGLRQAVSGIRDTTITCPT